MVDIKENEILTALSAPNTQEAGLSAARDAYGALVRRIIANVLTDPGEREECFADVWIRLWQTVPPAEPNSLRAYLCRIARNAALDRYRKAHAARRDRSRIDFLPDAELSEIVDPTADSDPARAVETGALTAAIEAFLDTLSADDRRLFVLRYWFFDPVTAVAKACGISENRVSVQLCRIRKKLHKYLEKEHIL